MMTWDRHRVFHGTEKATDEGDEDLGGIQAKTLDSLDVPLLSAIAGNLVETWSISKQKNRRKWCRRRCRLLSQRFLHKHANTLTHTLTHPPGLLARPPFVIIRPQPINIQ